MNFDKWARDLADQLREKEQVEEIKPEDLYTHKDIMRGEGMFSPDYNPANVKVTFDGEEINPVKDQHKGMDPPSGFNVGGNWFRDQQAYEEFLKLEEYTKLQEQARLLREELDKAPRFVLGHNCTSTETVECSSIAPSLKYKSFDEDEVMDKQQRIKNLNQKLEALCEERREHEEDIRFLDYDIEQIEALLEKETNNE